MRDRSAFELEADPPSVQPSAGPRDFRAWSPTCDCPRQVRLEGCGLECARCARPYLRSTGVSIVDEDVLAELDEARHT